MLQMAIHCSWIIITLSLLRTYMVPCHFKTRNHNCQPTPPPPTHAVNTSVYGMSIHTTFMRWACALLCCINFCVYKCRISVKKPWWKWNSYTHHLVKIKKKIAEKSSEYSRIGCSGSRPKLGQDACQIWESGLFCCRVWLIYTEAQDVSTSIAR